MDEDITRLKASISGSSRSILQEEKARWVMRLIAESNGITITEIRRAIVEYYNVQLGYAATKRIVEQLENEQYCTHIEQGQKKTGIKAVHIFFLVSTLSAADVIQVLKEKDSLALQSEFFEILPSFLTQSSKVTDTPYALLTETFDQLRLAGQEKHFELVALVGQGVSSMNALTSLTGDKRSSVHTRLTKLIRCNVLTREKRDEGKGLEFQYSLGAGIKAEHLKRFALEKGFSFPSIDLQALVQPETQHQEVKMSSQQSSPSPNSSDVRIPTHERLLEHLPKFDPTWPDETKADWIKAYRQIAELAQKSS